MRKAHTGALKRTLIIAGAGVLIVMMSCRNGTQTKLTNYPVDMLREPYDSLLFDDTSTTESPFPTIEYPNPFSTLQGPLPSMIREPGEVVVSVHVDDGGWVKTLCSTFVKQPGRYHIRWSQTDSSGDKVGSGVYWFLVHSKDTAISRKVVIMR